MDEREWLAERFEANRTHLRAVAYRMLGSVSEADDAVQESWLRLNRTESALQLGMRVHEPTARQMLGFVGQYKAQMPRVKQAYKCRNF